jgi:hypothetical protein
MPSILAHTASASFVALTFAQIQPDETSYVVAALISASILDLDHLVYVIKDRAMYQRLGYQGNLHQARSVFHELLGLLIAGVVSVFLFWADRRLAGVVFVAFATHVAQDWVIGKAHPLAPTDNTETQFFVLTFKQKVWVDIVIVTTFGVLWVLYLTGVV